MKNLGKLRYSKNKLFDLFFTFIALNFTQFVHSHGAVTDPPSRVWYCYQEIVNGDAGNPRPTSDACLAVYLHDNQALYDWNEVARMDGADIHEQLIDDGNLASAGRPDKYGGLDAIRDDWYTTTVSPGPFSITWTNSAPHQTLYYRVYITREDFNPAVDELGWDDLVLLTETEPRPAASVDVVDFVLPQRTGKHILYSVWQRSLSDEAFYSTIDVDFGAGITEPVEPIAQFTYDNGICGGPEVVFDASGSYDANGDELTYSWDFGDGNTAEGITVTHVFDGTSDTSLVTLTVSDSDFSVGVTDTINIVEDENCSALVCAFDAPRDSALPSIHTTYEQIYVIGDRGPSLDNVKNFTINWDLSNNGLYQFDFGLHTDPWNIRLLESEQNFNEPSSQISLEGTGIEGLDGDYYVTIDEGNFVLASITGGFTIYFSESAEAPECDDDIPVISDTLSGGVILTDGSTSVTNNDYFTFTIGDGIDNYVTGLTVEGSIGDSFVWLIADLSGSIVAFPDDIETFNFEDLLGIEDEERLFIYNLSYNGVLSNLFQGVSISELGGEYELSNSIEVYVAPEGTTITVPVTGTCTFDTPREEALPNLYARSYNRDQEGSITVIGDNGPDLSTWRKLDLTYQDGVISHFYYEEWFDQGNAKVELAGNITSHTFDQTNPEFTISNTGIDNLDGAYYVNIYDNDRGPDFQDFVMVSKTEGFSIYFTYSDEAPDCEGGLDTEYTDVVYDESIDGDLSQDNTAPTLISLSEGNNRVISTQTGNTDQMDFDEANFFTFEIPDGYELSELIVDNYEGGDDIGFIGIDEGSIIDLRAPNNPVKLLGGLSYGTANVGMDILPTMGSFTYFDPEISITNFTPPLSSGQYTVWLNQTGLSSTSVLNFVVSVEGGTSLSVDDFVTDNSVVLLQNYPNPFSTSTTINYELSKSSEVSLSIYNLKGQLVKSIDEGKQPVGNHEISFDLDGFSNGIYIYVLTTDKGIQTRRMILQK